MTEADSAPDSGLMLALADKVGDRMRRIMGAYYMASVSFRLVNRWRRQVEAQATYTVSVGGSDEIYPDLHAWVLDRLPARRQRAVHISTRRGNEVRPVDSVGDDGRKMTMTYDGSRVQTVTLGSHRVKVHVERPALSGWRDAAEENVPHWLLAAEKIVFTARTAEGREAVLHFLAEVAAKRSEREPRFNVADQWGEWIRRQELGTRPLSSVVLRSGQAEELIADLELFLAREREYLRLGVPYHRGYLFYGPGGTGKTSLAKALASHFRLDLNYIPLSSIADDSRLITTAHRINERSILLLEDVDVVHGTRDRDDRDKGVTLSGLLNLLDGLVTPHGLITIMTTNNLEVLDPALLRPGRMDRIEEFGMLDQEQWRRLVANMVWPYHHLPDLARPRPPAAAVEIIKRNMGDREATLAALKEFALSV